MRAALLLVLVAAPAFATGERVVVTAAAEPFRETICVSMTCVTGGAREAVVSARPVKGGVELTVKSAQGQVKLVHVAPLSEEGALSTIDVVRASSLVVQAIEAPRPPPVKVAKAPAKPKLRLLARR
ncbi:MAG: hypothetical protein SFW67_19740 [Myxococcaceae bacterium]|nr:hypothetical protein [Myxococcaceae bacterium]